MNNKGIDARIIGLIIGVLVLCGAIYAMHSDTFKSLFSNLLPNFGEQDQQTNENSASLVRYDLISNAVQSFDGNAWKNFVDGKAEVGGEKLEETKVKADFLSYASEYYFNKNSRGSNELFSDDTYKVIVIEIANADSADPKSPGWNVPGWLGQYVGKLASKDVPSYKQGAVIAIVSKNQQQYGLLFFDLFSQPVFKGVVQSSDSSEVPANPFTITQMDAMSSNVDTWRESVFHNHPVVFTDVGTFCAQLLRKEYIRVDLSQSPNSQGLC
jgi:hypothetical protein